MQSLIPRLDTGKTYDLFDYSPPHPSRLYAAKNVPTQVSHDVLPAPTSIYTIFHPVIDVDSSRSGNCVGVPSRNTVRASFHTCGHMILPAVTHPRALSAGGAKQRRIDVCLYAYINVAYVTVAHLDHPRFSLVGRRKKNLSRVIRLGFCVRHWKILAITTHVEDIHCITNDHSLMKDCLHRHTTSSAAIKFENLDLVFESYICQ
jgi:hypothetical protein